MYNYLKKIGSRNSYLLCFLLLLPALYAYNPFPLYFLNDDFIHVPLSQSGVFGQRNSIRPFNDFSLYADSLIWGDKAYGYHITNLLLHIINTVFLYFLSLKIFGQFFSFKNFRFWSVCAAVFFWSYAFHSESVLWVIGRTGSLSSLFFLICFNLFLSRKRRWFYYPLSFLSFLLGLLTYESIFVLLPTLIILLIFYKNLKTKANAFLIIGYLCLFVCYLILRIKWTGEIASDYEAGNLKTFDAGVLAVNYIELIARSFAAPQYNSFVFIVTTFIVTACFFTGWLIQVNKPVVAQNFLPWILITLVSFFPYISLGIDTHGVGSERYLYLPSIFIVLLVIGFFASWNNKPLAIIFLFGYFLYNQYYLIQSARAFNIASDIAQKTMNVIKTNRSTENIYITNLPNENYGIAIFRLGLEDGVNWQLKDNFASQKIKILSLNTRNCFQFTHKLNLNTKKIDKGFYINKLYVRDSVSNSSYVPVSKSGLVFHRGKDILIDYSDTAINVFK